MQILYHIIACLHFMIILHSCFDTLFQCGNLEVYINVTENCTLRLNCKIGYSSSVLAAPSCLFPSIEFTAESDVVLSDQEKWNLLLVLLSWVIVETTLIRKKSLKAYINVFKGMQWPLNASCWGSTICLGPILLTVQISPIYFIHLTILIG